MLIIFIVLPDELISTLWDWKLPFASCFCLGGANGLDDEIWNAVLLIMVVVDDG